MRANKRRIAKVGLAVLAVLGLMGMTAVGSQAAWLVLLTGTPTTLPDKTEVNFSNHTDLTILIPAKNLEILCNKTTSDAFLLRTSPLGFAEGSFLLSECEAFTVSPSLVRAPKCDPINQPIKVSIKAQLILHTGAGNNGHNYLLITPHFTIEFGPECALAETSLVKGSFVAECGHLSIGAFVHLDCVNHQVTQLIRQVAGTTLFPSDKLIYGLNTQLSIDGILAAKLAGVHAGFAWGGHV
jgi:hypothetical protein